MKLYWAGDDMRLIFLVAFVLLSFCGPIWASEESPVVFDSIKITSRGASNSGPVNLYGEYGEKGLKALQIGVFGKQVKLSKAQLDKISGLMVNGIQISLDGGYAGRGGKKVVIILSTGYAAGYVDKKYVIISENLKVDILDEI